MAIICTKIVVFLDWRITLFIRHWSERWVCKIIQKSYILYLLFLVLWLGITVNHKFDNTSLEVAIQKIDNPRINFAHCNYTLYIKMCFDNDISSQKSHSNNHSLIKNSKIAVVFFKMETYIIRFTDVCYSSIPSFIFFHCLCIYFQDDMNKSKVRRWGDNNFMVKNTYIQNWSPVPINHVWCLSSSCSSSSRVSHILLWNSWAPAHTGAHSHTESTRACI